MKCHYIYTQDGLKVLIPGCMAVAVSGDIQDCTCRNELTERQFERKEYNDTVKALRKEIKKLEEENAELNHIIEKLTTKWKKNTKA